MKNGKGGGKWSEMLDGSGVHVNSLGLPRWVASCIDTCGVRLLAHWEEKSAIMEHRENNLDFVYVSIEIYTIFADRRPRNHYYFVEFRQVMRYFSMSAHVKSCRMLLYNS